MISSVGRAISPSYADAPRTNKVYSANPLSGMANMIADVARHGAGAQANGISFASQNAQGIFNQGSADNANFIGDMRTGDQYGYNSAMWQQAADWNERMMQLSMTYNSEEAEKNRMFQKELDSTKYQRAIKDMAAAGLNPIMAVTGGGISVGGGTGSTASVGAPQMSAASGSLLNGISASEGNFTGQMDYLSGILGLISGALAGASSAMQNAGLLGMLGGTSVGEGLMKEMGSLFKDLFKVEEDTKNNNLTKAGVYNKDLNKYIPGIYKYTDRNGWYGQMNDWLKSKLGWPDGYVTDKYNKKR